MYILDVCVNRFSQSLLARFKPLQLTNYLSMQCFCLLLFFFLFNKGGMIWCPKHNILSKSGKRLP